ncbi:hypothetical protein EPI10_031719 [Gossypium australe]|uniref:Uncharacterized protein n=1 Tax=Gossypium australe TaxID=47621 RepID=A0A5B6X4J8_9ROSI|nr:hypothetical protein EPI10_031719 [Gossypium australe]
MMRHNMLATLEFYGEVPCVSYFVLKIVFRLLNTIDSKSTLRKYTYNKQSKKLATYVDGSAAKTRLGVNAFVIDSDGNEWQCGLSFEITIGTSVGGNEFDHPHKFPISGEANKWRIRCKRSSAEKNTMRWQLNYLQNSTKLRLNSSQEMTAHGPILCKN